ncbi:2-oxo acid dehydrogenase subunit E2 [Gammaproteobacteria bacterium]|nr:2-oxo acid dehydrogenase subunit E2 [Gammaproteobacteria bacterium]MDC0090047.1 2-oxo acid dehydrogenase subunit E2 [Gammaproteobacteria bacterium]
MQKSRNDPEVGTLGLSKTFAKVVAKNDGFESREFLPLSLSYDHRVINVSTLRNLSFS